MEPLRCFRGGEQAGSAAGHMDGPDAHVLDTVAQFLKLVKHTHASGCQAVDSLGCQAVEVAATEKIGYPAKMVVISRRVALMAGVDLGG